MKLEYVDSLTLAHPFVKGFEQTCYCLSEEESAAVVQGEISEAIKKRKHEDIEGKEGATVVHSTTFYIGLAIEPRQRAWWYPEPIRWSLICFGLSLKLGQLALDG
jgi:poly(A) polymerase